MDFGYSLKLKHSSIHFRFSIIKNDDKYYGNRVDGEVAALNQCIKALNIKPPQCFNLSLHDNNRSNLKSKHILRYLFL